MLWVTSTKRTVAIPRWVSVQVPLALWVALLGCGEKEGPTDQWVKPVLSAKEGFVPVPIPENRLDPVPLSDLAVLEGYTLDAPEGIEPGRVVEATLCYRSLKKQDGEFQVTIHLLGDGKELDNAANFVSTARWPRQKNSLEKDENFWVTASLRLPLGIDVSQFEIMAILGRIDEETQQVEPVPPPIRFFP